MSWYVKRERPGVVGRKDGWTGPIRSERQAHRERDAWIDAGWTSRSRPVDAGSEAQSPPVDEPDQGASVMRFDLKRVDGKTVTWEGSDGEDAAIRYVDAMRVAGKDDGGGIVATRPAKADRYGISVLGRGKIIG